MFVDSSSPRRRHNDGCPGSSRARARDSRDAVNQDMASGVLPPAPASLEHPAGEALSARTTETAARQESPPGEGSPSSNPPHHDDICNEVRKIVASRELVRSARVLIPTAKLLGEASLAPCRDCVKALLTDKSVVCRRVPSSSLNPEVGCLRCRELQLCCERWYVPLCFLGFLGYITLFCCAPRLTHLQRLNVAPIRTENDICNRSRR